ncbi:type II CRISPR-associated endonuclease Cas1 [Limoniibacter endophyticus]|uniref:CRISPR-associated endonuclease Cas1 n=1 Tax=Limoniibacter endophyticus TaxID=1565040 RepID=A0A8J3DI35_9HYPH|nr:type II CRISPR-associated endonuclease Cas1 [Limoniibacter endophyticus]GHC73656.1 CRISPR-associated endonuclease Cas1 [Limoniibacter endophyticus]
MERVIDIQTDGVFLSVHRGFLIADLAGENFGRIALDDIGALIVHAHGVKWSNTVFTRMSERGVPVVICGSNHAPIACIWPLDGHHRQAARMRAQIAAPKPLTKQLWRQVVTAKIRMQAAVLQRYDVEAGGLLRLARTVRSGDPGNIEAQAARRYWKALFGPNFSRDQNADGINSLLNYGYTVLRALVSRAICAAGLHPTIGIFHANSANAFALSDDLMEPYRPLVDMLVRDLVDKGHDRVTPETKQQLASIGTLDLITEIGTSPLSIQTQRFVYSVVTSFEMKVPMLDLPDPSIIATSSVVEEVPHDALGT